MKLRNWICWALLAVGGATSAQATLVEFTHSGYLRTWGIPGTAEQFTLTVRADNGGDGIGSQIWSVGDLISAVFESGSYKQTASGNFFGSPDWALFFTDPDGFLAFTNFHGTNEGTNQDSFGVGGKAYLAGNLVSDFYGRIAGFECCFENERAWTLAVVSAEPSEVPEPQSLALVGLAVVGLATTRRHKKA